MSEVNLDFLDRDEITALAKKSIAMVDKQTNEVYYIDYVEDHVIYFTGVNQPHEEGYIKSNDVQDHYWKFVERDVLVKHYFSSLTE